MKQNSSYGNLEVSLSKEQSNVYKIKAKIKSAKLNKALKNVNKKPYANRQDKPQSAFAAQMLKQI